MMMKGAANTASAIPMGAAELQLVAATAAAHNTVGNCKIFGTLPI
jgi:hypothetical protein